MLYDDDDDDNRQKTQSIDVYNRNWASKGVVFFTLRALLLCGNCIRRGTGGGHTDRHTDGVLQ